jgi:transcriptional regulator with XRE-family HTH domain
MKKKKDRIFTSYYNNQKGVFIMDVGKIGTFIAALRKSRGLTQQEVANSLGVSDKTISKWECGNGLPDITAIPAIAELFEVTADEILCGERIIGNKQAEREQKKKEEQIKYVMTVTYQQTKMQCIGIYVGMALAFLTSLYWSANNMYKMFYITLLIPSVIAIPRWVAFSDTAKRIKTNELIRQYQYCLKQIKGMTRYLSIALFIMVYVTVMNILPIINVINSNFNLTLLNIQGISLGCSLIGNLAYVRLR